MPTLKEATTPRDTSKMTLLTPSAPGQSPQYPQPPVSADPEFSPLAISPVPPVLGTDTDAARQFYRNGVSQIRMPPLPVQSKISLGAVAQSVQSTTTNVTNVTEGATDGLTHGQTNVQAGGSWESDPAYVILRDEFTQVQAVSSNAVPVSNIGQLGWNLSGGGSVGHAAIWGGIPPYIGQFWWDQNSTTSDFGLLALPQNGTGVSAAGGNNGWALFDYPGWQLTWVFKLGGTSTPGSVVPNLLQKSMYVGLMGPNQYENLSGNLSSRPEVFFGVRYDTSGPAAGTSISYAVTACGNASGGSTLYTGTFTGANSTTGTSWVGLEFLVTGMGAANNNGLFVCTGVTSATQISLSNAAGTAAAGQTAHAAGLTPMVATAAANGNGIQVAYTAAVTGGGTNNYVGQKFYVSGFGNAGNNGGPWVCTANTTTSITLANPVLTGSGETHAGYIMGPTTNDSTFVLEAVVNPSYGAIGRSNTQGTTLNTGLVPAVGAWHRLDITCSTAGVVNIILDDTHTLTTAVSPQSITTGASGLTGVVQDQQLNLSWSSVIGSIARSPWATGSKVTVSGFSSTQIGFNNGGTPWTILESISLSSPQLFIDYPAALTVTTASVAGTLSGYPAVFPACLFGNDNQATQTAASGTFWVDFFSFIWNPNLGPNAPGTPNSTLPRYW